MVEPLGDHENDIVEPWILGAPWRRVVVGVLFTILPIVSFIGSDGLLAPDWQDPTAEWSSVFANETRSALEMGALSLFGIGTAAIAWRPELRHHTLGRAVLAGAVVLSGFYAIALTVASSGVTIVMVISLAPLAAIGVVLTFGMRSLNEKATRAEAGVALRVAATAGIAALVTIVSPLREFVLSIAGWTVFALLGAGPILCCAVASRLLLSRSEAVDLRHVIPGVAAAATAATSIYVTWQRAMEHYATLSQTDPYADCYVASAAAHGHRAVVGSWAAPTVSGTVMVTRQLVDLKSVELLVRAGSPRLHRWIRFGYDKVGPHLARRVASPLRADLAWASMLPLGLAARLVLASMPTAARARVARLHPPADSQPPTNR